jgi:hypothetical protein
MAAPPHRFVVVEFHGIWCVTRDDQFFGDFRSKQHADQSVEEWQKAMGVAPRARGEQWRT